MVSLKIAQDVHKTCQKRMQDAPRCAQDAPRRAKMRPRRAQDAPRRRQDDAKTHPRRTQDATEGRKLAVTCATAVRTRSGTLPGSPKRFPRGSQNVPKTLPDAPKMHQRRSKHKTHNKKKRRFPFHVESGLCWRWFWEPRRAQDGPRCVQDATKTPQDAPKTLLRRLSDEKCDQDGYEEVAKRTKIHPKITF